MTHNCPDELRPVCSICKADEEVRTAAEIAQLREQVRILEEKNARLQKALAKILSGEVKAPKSTPNE